MKTYKKLLEYYKKLKLQISNLDNKNLKTITTAAEENLKLIDSQCEKIKGNINLHMMSLNDWKNWYPEFFVTLFLTVILASLWILGATMIIGTSFPNFLNNSKSALIYTFLTLPAIDFAFSIPFSLIKTKIKTGVGLFDALRGIKA